MARIDAIDHFLRRLLTAYVLCSLRLHKLKTVGQTIQTENLTANF